MTSLLDPRQRAMLAEMGVRVWAPTTAHAPTAAAQPATPAKATPAQPVTPVKETAAVRLAASPTSWAHLDWNDLQQTAANCQACGLCQGRQQSLFASGATPDAGPGWLLVGDAPSDAENLAGQAFVGDEGALLDALLQALGLSRTDHASSREPVVITNAVKCHPQGARNPSTEEWMQCQTFLQRQIELLQPKVILALGRLAAQTLLQPSLGEAAQQPLGKLRGQVHHVAGRPVVVTYHPAYLLRSPADKAKAWADLILALQQVRP